MPRLSLILKALRELGPRQVGLYAAYQILLRSGYLRWKTEVEKQKAEDGRQVSNSIDLPTPDLCPILFLPGKDELTQLMGDKKIAHLLAEADLIVEGQFRRFGVLPVPIELTPPGALSHWIDYEIGRQPWGIADPKFIWEPARFGWAFTLGRAYYLSGDERYPAAFWTYFEEFQVANPVNRGPNWASAQEVALRLLAFAFAGQIFSTSFHSTAIRHSQLAAAIAQHASRIPPSLLYARAQNNNHLLSEAAGLITAAACLPQHPQARRWAKLGWKWFNRGLTQQIDKNGAYSQHSANYHRLMLQLALWVNAIQRFSKSSTFNLKSATPHLQLAARWLLSITDPETGRVPNLGPNDGAYILPLTVQPFDDYRPTLQAASQAFLGEPAFEQGVWDEMGTWLKIERCRLNAKRTTSQTDQPNTLRMKASWAYLRAANFTGRPGHADQLHLDLWWRGLNIAQDAGTYLYNADPPWDNALTRTQVHNTITINQQEQMTRAGRFLYLDRAQAKIIAYEHADDSSWQRATAEHNGYRKMGLTHRRTVIAHADQHWIVTDELLPVSYSPSSLSACLHWLLPDWPWKLDSENLKLEFQSPHGWISLQISMQANFQPSTFNFQHIRAGELLAGSGKAAPYMGWVSPTYAQKIPALSWSIQADVPLPFTFTSEWRFPDES
ncbi:MAG: alginate lyase family protein [Anaerolineae bacterium]|nr:alginate lyase family protein [Anaerolineae bacterium]MBL6965840.1 alginate lyase family protein [Anaerolineales bacterium]